ncbi:MAG: DUF58 domain-containing protein [Crenarchaeota archaeon]|nr:DUF58 domain-containing protein [Thermoproteota archaeon]
MRITIVGASAIAVSIVSLLYAIARSSAVAAAVAIAILSIVVYDYYSAKSISGKIVGVRRILGSEYVSELGLLDVAIEVENRLGRYIPLVEVEDILPPMIEPASRSRFSISLPPGYVAKVRYSAKVKVPGEHCLDLVSVCVYSPFLMFVNCFDSRQRSYLVAVPLSPKISFSIRSLSRLVGLVRGLSMHGLYDLESFRDYVHGDDVRKVVWKVLARDRRLVVRVDRGESTARIAVILLLRRYAWVVGEPPNTLAQRVLRAFQSVIDTLSLPGVELDAYFLTSGVPRFVKSVRRGDPRMHSSYSWVSYLSGFSKSVSELLDLCSSLGIDLERYDFAILVTDLYTLARELDEVVKTLARTRRGLVIAALDSSVDVDHVALASRCSRRLDAINYDLALVSRELEVLTQ